MASGNEGERPDSERWPLPDDAEARAKHVLIHHQVRWDGVCFCGWDRRPGSYADHVLAEMRAAGIRLVLDEGAT